MRAVIMDESYIRLGEIDDYISFIWTERYYTTGDFELIVPITAENVGLCTLGRYVVRADIPTETVYGSGNPYELIDNVGVIETLEYEEGLDGVERLHVSGRFLTGVLARRVCLEWRGTYTLPQVVYRIIDENMAVGASADRVIPELDYPSWDDDQTGITETIDVVFNGENLLSAVESIAENYGFGFKMQCLPLYKPLYMSEAPCWRLHMYKGEDRSYGQNVNPYVVFADAYDNLTSSYYTANKRDYVTDVLVNGEILDTGQRYVTWASNGATNTGLNRYEAFVESAQVRTLDDGTVLSDAQYIANLQQEGRLSLHNLEEAFSGGVLFGQYKYRQDVNVGDVVTIRNDRWGIYVNARIIEMIESVSESGEYTCTPTFGA